MKKAEEKSGSDACAGMWGDNMILFWWLVLTTLEVSNRAVKVVYAGAAE